MCETDLKLGHFHMLSKIHQNMFINELAHRERAAKCVRIHICTVLKHFTAGGLVQTSSYIQMMCDSDIYEATSRSVAVNGVKLYV